MRAGVIAVVESDELLNEFQNEVLLNDDRSFSNLKQSIQIRQELELDDGRHAQIGRAAIEDIHEVENVTINESGEISTRTIEEKFTRYTEFVFVSNSFISVESSSGEFLFDLLNNQLGIDVNRVDINLDKLASDHEDALTWKVGFNDRGSNAENGIVHGDDVFQDPEVGDVLGASNKNQLGLEYEYRSDIIKVFLTESSYIEVYQPSNYDTKDFVQFVENEILHLTQKR